MKFNRKICLRWLGPIGWFLLGALFGLGCIILWYCLSNTNLKIQDYYDPWDITNKLFQIIGAIGTVLAVIVALTKEAIMKWLYSPSLSTSLIDGGITENISENQRVPEANSFECLASIDNKGSIAALGCKVYVSDVKYGKSKINIKSIKNSGGKQLRWTSLMVDIPIGIPSKIRLFEIVNPNSVGTPGKEVAVNPKISFNGLELRNHYLEKGYWEIEYYISCKNGNAFKFVLYVEWTGEFKSRATDMADVLKVQIEEK